MEVKDCGFVKVSVNLNGLPTVLLIMGLLHAYYHRDVALVVLILQREAYLQWIIRLTLVL